MSRSCPQTEPKSFKAVAFQLPHEQLDSVKENLAVESSETDDHHNEVDGSCANNAVETLDVNTPEERTETEENGTTSQKSSEERTETEENGTTSQKSSGMPAENGNLPSEESSVTPAANIRGTKRPSSDSTELSDQPPHSRLRFSSPLPRDNFDSALVFGGQEYNNAPKLPTPVIANRYCVATHDYHAKFNQMHKDLQAKDIVIRKDYDTIEEQKKQLSEIQNANLQLQRENQEVKEQLGEIKNANLELQRENQEVKEQLRMKDQKIEDLTKANSKWKNKYAEEAGHYDALFATNQEHWNHINKKYKRRPSFIPPQKTHT